MFGARVTPFVGTFRVPLVVTNPDFSLISTEADVDSMSPKTMQPALLVVPSRVSVLVELVGVKVTTAVTPGTPSVGLGLLPTSTSRPAPVGGVMMLDSLTSGRFAAPSDAQVTLDVISTLAPVCLVVSTALQPVVFAEPLLGAASWVIS